MLGYAATSQIPGLMAELQQWQQTQDDLRLFEVRALKHNPQERQEVYGLNLPAYLKRNLKGENEDSYLSVYFLLLKRGFKFRYSFICQGTSTKRQ